MKTKLAVLALAVCVGVGLGEAQATPITIEIVGNVTSASGSAPPGTIYAGVGFTGSYTYDSSTIDSGGGNYVHSWPYGINLVIGGYEFKTAPNHTGKFVISILDEYQPPFANIHDDYWVKSYENMPLANGMIIEAIEWTLLDGSRTALSSSALLVVPPDLNDWSLNYLRIYGSGRELLIQGTVTQAVLIPEPLMISMMAMGIVFCSRGRQSGRQSVARVERLV